ncbi:RNA polymerase I-specific transcription initiation factor Rrn7 [Aspergillus ellipticus CBS 707.79]|uniref:RNA polymerase I-specific transcription initiation factor Rrn7 n=1 Tax=Aspergillus ellipticus CBS 707.79 TaxID=1448320 RepID=A0A319E128_9EURO|nr:RNA polymerase I-specific transcription initiation factor Rrn7 [Aspergillus ellipticus CBS 707.79]
MEYTTRGVCGQEGCRERRYYLENGLWFCRRGHQQEGRQVEEDPEDFGTQGRTSRVKKAAAEKATKTFRGRQAYRLFLHVYQLILWKQCYALVNTRGFPDQFEHVVRDLWGLWLGTFEDQIKEQDEPDEQPELFSSQPTQVDGPADAKPRIRKAKWPRMIDSISLCYLGAFLMRLPVSVGDFHLMVMRGDVPYLRVVRDIPRDMRDNLPPEFISILEPRRLLQAEELHTAVGDLVLLYHSKFSMKFPSVNWPILLYRYIKRLAIPIDVYPTVKKLQELLGLVFEYPGTIIGRRKPLELPELQLMSLIVVATKLLFPFDRKKRYPSTTKEPAVQVMDWNHWAEIQGRFDNRETSRGKIGKGNEVNVTEKDVFEMTPAQLDEYMDWYESSWLDASKPPSRLANLFPLGPSARSRPGTPSVEINEGEALDAMVQISTGQLKSKKVIPSKGSESESDTPRPGSSYARFRTESDLLDEARPFYETAAKVVGVSLSTLVRGVLQAENKITRWLAEQRKAEFLGESLGMGRARDSGDEMDVD